MKVIFKKTGKTISITRGAWSHIVNSGRGHLYTEVGVRQPEITTVKVKSTRKPKVEIENLVERQTELNTEENG